jgi:galactokinase
MKESRGATREYVVPGRIELVGKHVDYAGGRSLTCATEFGIRSRVTAIGEPVIRVRRGAGETPLTVPLSPDAAVTRVRSGAYVTAVARRLARDFPDARTGISVELQSDLPTSAGVSSSSALVVTLAMAFIDANDLGSGAAWRAAVPNAIARAEYFAAIETGAPFGPFAGDGGVGVRGGAQDHVAIVCAEEGQVAQFRYLPARLERRDAWPREFVLAIGVSGVHATKTGNAQAAYNRLSDAMRSDPFGATLAADDRSPAETAERRAQFREETDVIVPGVSDALRFRDWSALGTLVDRSQQLAEQVLRNQVPETIFLAREARRGGAVAASAFGAGFGGAVWAMIPAAESASFLAKWRAAYDEAFPARRSKAKWLATRPAGPARRIV